MSHSGEQQPQGRLLIVDDQANMCWVLEKILSERGHQVYTALNGAEALVRLTNFDCQVAVVDYRLPDIDGLELMIKMIRVIPYMKFIFMTSYGDAALRQRASEMNCFAYFDKPFRNCLMIGAIEDALHAWESGGNSLMREILPRV